MNAGSSRYIAAQFFYIGASPSGKATGFDPVIQQSFLLRRFESGCSIHFAPLAQSGQSNGLISHVPWVQIPKGAPICRCSLMVEHQPSKLACAGSTPVICSNCQSWQRTGANLLPAKGYSSRRQAPNPWELGGQRTLQSHVTAGETAQLRPNDIQPGLPEGHINLQPGGLGAYLQRALFSQGALSTIPRGNLPEELRFGWRIRGLYSLCPSGQPVLPPPANSSAKAVAANSFSAGYPALFAQGLRARRCAEAAFYPHAGKCPAVCARSSSQARASVFLYGRLQVQILPGAPHHFIFERKLVREKTNLTQFHSGHSAPPTCHCLT